MAMQVSQFSNMPEMYPQLVDKSNEIGFDMPSDIGVGRLLRTLVRSKPNGRFLELGTGMGLSLSWMVAGMGTSGTMVSIDNDTKLIEIVKAYFEAYTNVQCICEDGGHWIETNRPWPTSSKAGIMLSMICLNSRTGLQGMTKRRRPYYNI